jgi:hypothetical protein
MSNIIYIYTTQYWSSTIIYWIYIYIYYNYNYISIYRKNNILSSLTIINHSISPWYPRCIGCQASLGEAARRHGILQKSWKEAVQASGVWVGQLTMGIHGNPWERNMWIGHDYLSLDFMVKHWHLTMKHANLWWYLSIQNCNFYTFLRI